MKEKSLIDLRPDICKEWNYEKNSDLKPSDVLPGSGKLVWWKCKKGHEWKAKINDRTRTPKEKQINGTGCPYCNNRKVCEDNNLEVLNKALAKEWNYKKNGTLKPRDIVVGSSKKVWWICKEGHEWEARVADRNNGRRCPYCLNQKVSKDNSLAAKNQELSEEWHVSKNGNLTPNDIVPGSSKKVWWTCRNNESHEWQATVKSRNEGRGCPMCDNSKVSFPQMAIYYYMSKIFNKVRNRYKLKVSNTEYEIDTYIPEIEFGIEYDGYYWHRNSYEKDLDKSTKVMEEIKLIRIREYGLSKIIEECDYVRKDKKYSSLEDAIQYICNYILNTCSLELNLKNKLQYIDINIDRDKLEILSLMKDIINKNSIASKYPDIAKEFDQDRNNNLKPENISCYSKIKLWWKCSKDNNHIWEASAEKRCGNKGRATGCPYCSNRKVDDSNSLARTRPDLEKIWNHEKNTDITSNDVVPTSEKSVWWKCDKNPNHQWYKKIKYVAETKGIVCPFCRKSKEDTNTLKIKRIDLYKQIHPTKNSDINLSDLTCSSNKKIWWKCEKGHEWQGVVANRNRAKSDKCPICTKTDKLPIIYNGELKRQWNYDKNINLDIGNITKGSSKKVWWKCEKGHEWQATVVNRINGRGCPYCSGKKVCKDNSLEIIAPDLCQEWNYDKNINIKPSDVVTGSNKKVWWKCTKGHEWEARINDRYNKNKGCPYCSGQKVCKDNSLETLRPDIAKEWNSEKNDQLKPSDVTVGSGKKVWWKCDNGHEWQATIGDRTRGRGCKQCKKMNYSK